MPHPDFIASWELAAAELRLQLVRVEGVLDTLFDGLCALVEQA